MSKTVSKIKRAMIAKGLNQTDLSKLSGVRRATINDLLAGRTEPRTDTLGPLFKVLEIDLDDFEDDSLNRLIKLAGELTSEERDTVALSIESLLKAREKSSNVRSTKKSRGR
jgi:transcriptional regulator with XRE-family HTH domain